MGIDPYNCYFSSQTLADCSGSAGDGANRNAVVSAEGQHEAASFCVSVYFFAQLLCHRRDSTRVLHAAVVWVGLWPEAVVAVDFIVAVEVVAEFVVQLLQQASGDKSVGGGVDAGFALAAAEANGDDAKLGGSGEELGTDC